MIGFVRSEWLPLALGLLLVAAAAIAGDSPWATFLYAHASLLMMDSKAWMDACLCTHYFYETEDGEIDWLRITKEAYNAPSFHIRLVAYGGLAGLLALAFKLDRPVLWGACFLAGSVYLAALFFLFRRDITYYMRSIGVPARAASPVAGEARFDTRNPEDRTQ